MQSFRSKALEGRLAFYAKILARALPHLILIFILACIAIAFFDIARRFQEAPFDGVFQTLYALRKIDAGELPGRDFFYFHGNGIPYLLYPLYKLFEVFTGHELLASLLATFFMNLIFLYAPIYVIFYRFFSASIASYALVLISFANEFIFFLGFYNSPLFIGAPMGIRMSPHLLTLMLLACWSGNSKSLSRGKYILLGLLLGIGPLLGAEQGVYAIGGSTIAVFFSAARPAARFTNATLVIVSALTSLILAQLLLFGSLDTLRAIKVISDNQVWVYGVPPNTYIERFSDFFHPSKLVGVPSQITTISATAAVALLILARTENRNMVTGVIAIYFGGLLSWASNLGYVGQHQSAIFMKLILIVAAFFLFSNLRQDKEKVHAA